MRKTFPRQSKRRCDPQSRWARAFLAGSASAFEASVDCIDLTDLCSTSPSFRPPIQRPVDCVADAQSGALLACIAALDDPDSKISRAVAARPAPRTMGCLSAEDVSRLVSRVYPAVAGLMPVRLSARELAAVQAHSPGLRLDDLDAGSAGSGSPAA